MRALYALMLAFLPVLPASADDKVHRVGLVGIDPAWVMECKNEDRQYSRKCKVHCTIDYFRGQLGQPSPPPSNGSGFTIQNVDAVDFYQRSSSGGIDRSMIAWRQWLPGATGRPERAIVNWAFLGTNITCQSDIVYEPDNDPTGKIHQLIVTRHDP